MERKFSYLKLSDVQIELLMECHESQLLKREPMIGPHLMQQSCALAKWGLIAPQSHFIRGKNLTRFFITPLGIEFLATISKGY